MKERSVLVACKIFHDELLSILPTEKEMDIIWVEAALHADLPKLERELTGALCSAKESGLIVRVLYGSGCHPELAQLAGRFGAGLAPVRNCIEAYCGERRKELEQNRTMIMTPGWIRVWPGIMEALGWDEVDARINLGRYDRILLLDPGIKPLSEEEILNFFDLVQVPVEMEPLDLGHFRRTLDEFLS